MIRTLALAGVAAFALSNVAQAQMTSSGPAPAAPDFVAQAGASDKFEITEAKLAKTHSHSAAIKKFAAKMIHDHTESTMKVKAAATQVMGHAPPPPMLMPDQEKMIADLRGEHGKAFDQTYLQQQMQAHEQALALMQGYAANGDAPPLKQAASEIAPHVQEHIDMLKSMSNGM